jgi:hypothetical protein
MPKTSSTTTGLRSASQDDLRFGGGFGNAFRYMQATRGSGDGIRRVFVSTEPWDLYSKHGGWVGTMGCKKWDKDSDKHGLMGLDSWDPKGI